MRKDDAKERKDTPVYSGVLKYFPNALAEVARVSKAGNDQHNPGKALHWDRSKSKDELDALTRHLLDRAAGDEFDRRQGCVAQGNYLGRRRYGAERTRTYARTAPEG
jgi:hypothetical protein